MQVERPNGVESSFQSLKEQIPDLLQKSRDLGRQFVNKAKEKALNCFEIDMLIDEKFQIQISLLEKLHSNFQKIQEYLLNKRGEPTSQEVNKIQEQTDTFEERMRIAESKLSRAYKRLSETFDEKAIQVARFLHNQVEQVAQKPQNNDTFEMKTTMEFELTEIQYEYLYTFFDKVKEDLILAGVPRHFDFDLVNDQNRYLLNIKMLPGDALPHSESVLEDELDQLPRQGEMKRARTFSEPVLNRSGSSVVKVSGADLERRYMMQAKISELLSQIQTYKFFLQDWEMEVLQLRSQDGHSSILDSFLHQKYLPVVIRIKPKRIEVTTSNFTYAQHFIQMIHEKIHKRPTRKQLKIEGKHLPILSELMKSGFLLQLGFEKNCYIHFGLNDNSLDFVLDIYHSPNKDLARLAQEAAWAIEQKCEHGELAQDSLKISDPLQLAFLQGNMDEFEKQVKMAFPGTEIILGQKQLLIRAKHDDIETLKMIIPQQIKQLKSALPLVQASRNFKIMQAVFPEMVDLLLKNNSVQMIELDQPEMKPGDEKQEAKQELEGPNIPLSVYLQGTHQNIFEVEQAAKKMKNDKVAKRVIQGCKIDDQELLEMIGVIDQKCQCQLYRSEDDETKYVIEGLLVDRAAMHLQKYFHGKKQGSMDIAYPQIWQPMDEAAGGKLQCHRFDIDPKSNEFTNIEQRFMQTMNGFGVISIQRIQNPILWKKYAIERQFLANKRKGNPNERQMFHGTRTNDPALIYNSRIGFDFRFCNAGAWGLGSYFARDASYSNGYHYNVGDGSMLMFLALVLEGDGFRTGGNGALKMPPLKNNRGTQRFDSVTSQDGSICIVYEHAKAYPAYLIQYTNQNNIHQFGRGGVPAPPQILPGWGKLPQPRGAAKVRGGKKAIKMKNPFMKAAVEDDVADDDY